MWNNLRTTILSLVCGLLWLAMFWLAGMKMDGRLAIGWLWVFFPAWGLIPAVCAGYVAATVVYMTLRRRRMRSLVDDLPPLAKTAYEKRDWRL